MPYYNICPHCGSHLDPGERCDCQDKDKKPERQEATEKTKEDIKRFLSVIEAA